MNDQLDLRLRGGRDLGEDLLNQEADDSLLGSDVRGGIGPHAREFFGERQEAGTIEWSLSRGLDLDRCHPLLQQPDPLEGAVPAPLQRLGHQAMLGLDGVVLPVRALRLVARLAEFQLERVVRCRRFLGRGVRRHEGRLDGARREDAKDLPLDRFIHAEPTEGDAAPRAMIDVSTAATVPRDVAFGAGVRHVEAAPTAAAAEETCDQTRPAPHRPFHHESFHLRVVGDERPISLPDVPGNIRLVVVTDQRDPLLALAAMVVRVPVRPKA